MLQVFARSGGSIRARFSLVFALSLTMIVLMGSALAPAASAIGVVIGIKPPVLSANDAAFFTMRVTGGTGTLTCRLDGGLYQTCPTKRLYRNLSDGRHVFVARVTQVIRFRGRVRFRIATQVHIWRIDTTAPSEPQAFGGSPDWQAPGSVTLFASGDLRP